MEEVVNLIRRWFEIWVYMYRFIVDTQKEKEYCSLNFKSAEARPTTAWISGSRPLAV